MLWVVHAIGQWGDCSMRCPTFSRRSGGSSIKNVRKNRVKIDPFPLFAFVRIGPYPPLPLLRMSANVTKYAVNSDSWTSVITSDREWLLLAPAGHSVGCRMTAGAIAYTAKYASVYTLHGAIYSAFNFITILSPLSTVHWYALRTSALTKTPPLCPFFRIEPYPPSPSVRTSFVDDSLSHRRCESSSGQTRCWIAAQIL